MTERNFGERCETHMEKTTIEQLEIIIREMSKVKIEHPKAHIYYDWKEGNIRIIYPLPRDFYIYATNTRTSSTKDT